MRKNLGLSQKELAEKMGLASQTQISRFEGGFTAPSIEAIMRLCESYDIDLNYLIAGKTKADMPNRLTSCITAMAYSHISLTAHISAELIGIAAKLEDGGQKELAERLDGITAKCELEGKRTLEHIERLKNDNQ